MRDLRVSFTASDIGECKEDTMNQIAQQISSALTEGCDRFVAKNNNNGYSTLLYALMPGEEYQLLEDEYFMPVPKVDYHE